MNSKNTYPHLKNLIKNRLNSVLDIILPKTCQACKKEGEYLCQKCQGGLEIFEYPLCPICHKRIIEGIICKKCRVEINLTRFFTALPYENELVRNMLWNFKYWYAKGISEVLAEILIKFLNKNNFSRDLVPDKTIFIPVPLISTRKKERGFNQSEEIAKCLSEYFKVPIDIETLVKIKHTSPQAEIEDLEERRKNVGGSFACKNPALIRGKIVILVDDVYTTGSTMRECAQALKNSGAKEIWGIALIKG